MTASLLCPWRPGVRLLWLRRAKGLDFSVRWWWRLEVHVGEGNRYRGEEDAQSAASPERRLCEWDGSTIAYPNLYAPHPLHLPLPSIPDGVLHAKKKIKNAKKTHHLYAKITKCVGKTKNTFFYPPWHPITPSLTTSNLNRWNVLGHGISDLGPSVAHVGLSWAVLPRSSLCQAQTQDVGCVA